MGLVMQTISFIPLLVGGSHLAILLLAIILFEVGNQFGQVANQTRVQGLGEAASNRNNTVFTPGASLFLTRGKCLNLLVNLLKNAYSSLNTPKL
ncbi:hypothetical protein ACPTI3_14060, partial [Enterococcus faecium]